jgi:4-aminobutyrate aminotransferase-like enzyme
MGNGFPVAGIAVAPEIVEEFGRDTRYFNTFGGNAVAIAAAQATLDVIRDEQLLKNAEKMGQLMRDGLKEIAACYEGIGDVRGAGLYIGVEMVKDRTTREPDAAAASTMVNGLRERRVLISVTGCNANTLKIRPPLVFSAQNVTRLLTEFEAVAKSHFM